MTQPIVMKPAEASRVVTDENTVVLVGQPPEILKNLLLNKIFNFDAMLLTDIREKDGSLLNNLEFPFYFFLFVAKGLEEERKLILVGEEADISQALRLLRITLMGPTPSELDEWDTEQKLKGEWIAVAEALAVKDKNGVTIPVENYFETIPFKNGKAKVGSLTINHLGTDHYEFSNSEGTAEVDLNNVTKIRPPYEVQPDYVPGGLIKLGVEVLGGASGFSVDEPCTGLALCYNGDYMLIDSIPFLDQHLYARGISKNQISSIFLTHLHDDHCSMFPLMMMPNRVEVITTKEIYNMAMDKLACNLGWEVTVIAEHFHLIEVKPGEALNYYGLIIEPHVTVHSIPTIGATFSMGHKEAKGQLCIVGDNNSLASIRSLYDDNVVRESTMDRLESLFRNNYNLFIADGGAGAIHGDPADALNSDADRIIFVHIDELPPKFNNTFSLASSGKRYTIFDGDPSINTSQVSHYLSVWLGSPFPNRWMRSLLAQEEIRRYNSDDVIVVQDSASRGFVYLILTGYCNVVTHDGEQSHTVAELQAGDLIGEMAVITGSGSRNASVVASTPVTICVFSEQIFGAFIESEGFKADLLRRYSLRQPVSKLPQFSSLTSTVIEKVCRVAKVESLEKNQSKRFDDQSWYILQEGQLESGEETGHEFGWKPLSDNNLVEVTAKETCSFVYFDKHELEELRLGIPQLNYMMRKRRVSQNDPQVDWKLGIVPLE